MFLDDKAARGSAKSPVTSICIIEDSHQDPPAQTSANELVASAHIKCTMPINMGK